MCWDVLNPFEIFRTHTEDPSQSKQSVCVLCAFFGGKNLVEPLPCLSDLSVLFAGSIEIYSCRVLLSGSVNIRFPFFFFRETNLKKLFVDTVFACRFAATSACAFFLPFFFLFYQRHFSSRKFCFRCLQQNVAAFSSLL